MAAFVIGDGTWLQSKDITTEETSPSGLFFKSDGSTMWTSGFGGDDVQEWSLSTDWDVSSATHVQNFDLDGKTDYPEAVFFKPDGYELYVPTSDAHYILQYTLSTAWDISSATWTRTETLDGAVPQGLFFNPTGTKMYVNKFNEGTVVEYALSSAWDISSATDAESNLDVSAKVQNPQGVHISSDGYELTVSNSITDTIYQYSLSTAWDISTGTYSSSLYVGDEDATPNEMFFKTDGTKFYVCGLTDDVIAEYDLVSAGTNMQINIGDAWKESPSMKINIGDSWKEVAGVQVNIGDSWKEVF